MDYKIQNLSDITPSTWSGGKTYEILIGGKGKDYAKRDFGYRVSSATCDLEESTFSDLPLVNRYITTLKGSLKIEHRSPMTDALFEEKTLNPFDVHYFDGGVKTVSYGKVQDFNLMLDKDTCGGEMKSYDYSSGVLLIADKEHKQFGCEVKFVVFCAEGQVKIHNTNQILNANDFIIEHSGNDITVEALTPDTKYIVCSTIYKA
ncbi:MAG: HutD family protein [Lachnospiraceae bacterium]|nr:HutD family protein [Lachnospiraceae bacterium]